MDQRSKMEEVVSKVDAMERFRCTAIQEVMVVAACDGWWILHARLQ